jgi:hypothetical protein
VATRRKKLKKSKRVKLHFCTNCCQWVETKWPHSCYDFVRSIVVDLWFRLIKSEDAVQLLRDAISRTKTYRDF